MGGLLSNSGLYPFMYRGKIADLNTANQNGFYEMYGNVSNAPFGGSWAPTFTIGNNYKVQFAFYGASDKTEMYIRLPQSNNLGWRKVVLTDVTF